ncbi:MAG: hypothetical protein ABH816_00340 [Candidatus Levyibacteriota bacterium]
MELSKKSTAVLYIEGNRVIFYGGNVSQMLSLDIPLEIVSDVEVLDKEKLFSLISAFVQSNKIEASNLLILLSTMVTFEKDFQEAVLEDLEEEIQKFIDLVPFQDIDSKKIMIGKKCKIVAINKEFCEAFKNAFERLGFSITAVVPTSVLQETIPELSSNLDLNLVLNKVEFIKQFSILTKQETRKAVKEETQKKEKSKKTLVLSVVVGLSLVVLIVLIFTNVLARPAPRPKTIKNTAPKPSPTEYIEDTLKSSSPSGIINPSPTGEILLQPTTAIVQ